MAERINGVDVIPEVYWILDLKLRVCLELGFRWEPKLLLPHVIKYMNDWLLIDARLGKWLIG